MTSEELAKQIEDSDLTEEELEAEGWGRVCGNLPEKRADTMKAENPARVKILDNLNSGTWLILEYGYKDYIPQKYKPIEEETETIEEIKTEEKTVGSQSWFDL